MTPLSSANHLLLELAPAPLTEAWQVHINQFCLQGLAPWLEDEFGVSARQLEAVARSHGALWDWVSGSAVPIGQDSRLVLVPSAAIDLSELRVPQEWVDIPSWVGDYYIAVRVNPDSGQLCIWGYTTHAYLKQQGRYDAVDRSYCLDGEAVTDLAVLPAVRELGVTEPTRSSVEPLPVVPAAQVDSLVQRLTHPDCLMPRLAVPFSLWGALLADAELRSRLSGQSSTNLSQWMAGAVNWLALGWQTLETLLPAPQAATAFRAGGTANTVKGGKRLALGTTETGETATVVLLISVEKEADERMSIRVQLRPAAAACLPEELELSLLSPAGEAVQTVRRQSLDDYIQLKRFRLPPGYPFTIQVCSGSVTVQEAFTT
ncbi:MAG: DUF1822 family protein [Cyanobacteria bacterium P01_A01_bin.105]